MADPVKPLTTPAPDYPRRRRRAEATRARVLDAARARFIEHGYVATTIDAIAADADVAPETVYAAFGTKRAILAAIVDRSISGEPDAGPLMAQAWVDELRTEPDRRRRIRLLARTGRAILERRHAIDEVVRSAAASDADLAALHALGKNQRHAGQRELVRIVVGDTGLRAGLDLDTAADTVYAIGSPETFRLLVVDRGWSGESFERWYGDTLERLLLDPDG